MTDTCIVSSSPATDELPVFKDDPEPPEDIHGLTGSGFSHYRGRMQKYVYGDDGDMELCYEAVDENLDVLMKVEPSSMGHSKSVRSVSISVQTPARH